MKLTISTKLIGMMVVAALVPVAVVGIVSFLRASTALTEAGLSKVEQEASLTDRDLNTFLGQFSSDLLAFSATPPIQGIIRARDNGGIDPKSNDPYEVWVNRLTQIFKANAINKEFYQQLRYIDENGDEMVKTMNDVSSITEQNSAASEQMAADSTEVSKSIESITAVSEQNSAATEEMSAQVQEVVASTQDLDSMTQDLQAVVSTFKLDADGAPQQRVED